MNFVSRQAQEAILDPNLPASYKDAALAAALEALLKIAEKRSVYNTNPRENQGGEAVPNDLRSEMKKEIDFT